MDETITSNLILDYQKDNSTLYSISNNNNITNNNNNSNNNSSGNNNINIEYENNSLLGEEFAKLYEAPAEVIAILSLFYGGISIIAIIGNTLVIWIVATTRQMRTVTNLYIANLAFSDVIIGMFCIPFQFQAALLQRWNLPEFMCAFCPFVQVLSVNVSVFTLTAIAIDRHRAIINPLRARPTRFFSKVIIITIWIAATAFSIPCAIAFRVIQITEIYRENGVIKNVTRPFCENVNLTEDQLKSYRYYLVFVQYVVPLCVISFIYIQMAIKLWGSRTPGNAQDSRDITLLRNKKKVIKMLIIVVVVFGVCWLPLQTYNILYVTLPYINEYRFINIIWFCCDWLAMSNSCYNPFIYGIYNEKFKREFNKRFSLCFCNFDGRDTPDRSFSVYTRASSIRSNYTTNQNPNNYNNHYNGITLTRYNSSNSSNNNRNNILNQQHQQQQQQKRISLLKTTSADTYCNGNDKNDSNESIMNSKQFMTTINNNRTNKSVLLLEQKHKLKCKPKQQQKQKYFCDDLNTRTTNLECDDKLKNDYNDRYNPLCTSTSIIPSEDSKILKLLNNKTENNEDNDDFDYDDNNDNANVVDRFYKENSRVNLSELFKSNSKNNDCSNSKKKSNNYEMTEYHSLNNDDNYHHNDGSISATTSTNGKLKFTVKFNNF